MKSRYRLPTEKLIGPPCKIPRGSAVVISLFTLVFQTPRSFSLVARQGSQSISSRITTIGIAESNWYHAVDSSCIARDMVLVPSKIGSRTSILLWPCRQLLSIPVLEQRKNVS